VAKFLRDLLGAQEPLFGAALQNLERASGHSGLDARLIGDILLEAHSTMRRMGLDPADTTGLELYNALKSHAGDEYMFTETEYVGLKFADNIVSFNPVDIQENANKPYGEHTTENMKCALQRELVDRYIQHEQTEESVVQQFASDAGLHICDEKHLNVDKEETMEKPYILCIGDIITDAFIKLSEDHAQVITDDKGYKRLMFELGAKLPYDQVDIVQAVECSPNAAVSLTRLGIKTTLMSWIGDDTPGKEMIEYLKEQGVGTDDLVVEAGMKSNYHYVLRYGPDRTKLQRFEDYSYQWREPAQKPDWVYLGVLGEKTWPLHEELLKYLEKNPDIKLVFQPGMYHLMWDAQKVAPFYNRAELVIMNREEAAQVTQKDRESIPGLMEALHGLGVKVAVVTDGADGAYASEGGKIFFMQNYPDPKPPYDRTGAGDAFASTIAAALALGEPLETALEWAPINSMSVVQLLGAQAGLLTKDEIKAYLQDAPESYHVEELK
jgi:sugar/nucleoside kinase (ribokinase family)